MRTGCYRNYHGPGGIRISLSAPRFRKDGQTMASCRSLMPAWSWLKLDEEEFRTRFLMKLASLDCQDTIDKLHAAVHPNEPVLLCYETLKDDADWCHRTMVSTWIEIELGLVVPEVTIQTTGEPRQRSYF